MERVGDNPVDSNSFFNTSHNATDYSTLPTLPGNSNNGNDLKVDVQVAAGSRLEKVGDAFRTTGKLLGRGLAGMVGGVVALVGGVASLTMTAVTLLLKVVALPLGAVAGGLVGAVVGLLRGKPLDGIVEHAKTGVAILSTLTQIVVIVPATIALFSLKGGLELLGVATDKNKELDAFFEHVVKIPRKIFHAGGNILD